MIGTIVGGQLVLLAIYAELTLGYPVPETTDKRAKENPVLLASVKRLTSSPEDSCPKDSFWMLDSRGAVQDAGPKRPVITPAKTNIILLKEKRFIVLAV